MRCAAIAVFLFLTLLPAFSRGETLKIESIYPSKVGNLTVEKNALLATDGVSRVGIGKTSPEEKLEVSGNIKLSGESPTYKIINVVAPIANNDVATKAYVDGMWEQILQTDGCDNTSCSTSNFYLSADYEYKLIMSNSSWQWFYACNCFQKNPPILNCQKLTEENYKRKLEIRLDATGSLAGPKLSQFKEVQLNDTLNYTFLNFRKADTFTLYRRKIY